MDAYSFPLAWRWTQVTHSVLPADVMARIIPMVERPLGRPSEQLLGAHESIATDSVPQEEVRQWLADRRIAPESIVTVCWNGNLAIETTWAIFSEYWDSFCYPSSDDVEVVPVTQDWLLEYHHWEAFEFRGEA